MLADFDRELITKYPGLSYSRYIHDCFVAVPLMSLEIENVSIEKEIMSCLFELNLFGEILSIVPGDAPVPCCGNLVFISRDGLIQVVETESFSLFSSFGSPVASFSFPVFKNDIPHLMIGPT